MNSSTVRASTRPSCHSPGAGASRRRRETRHLRGFPGVVRLSPRSVHLTGRRSRSAHERARRVVRPAARSICHDHAGPGVEPRWRGRMCPSGSLVAHARRVPQRGSAHGRLAASGRSAGRKPPAGWRKHRAIPWYPRLHHVRRRGPAGRRCHEPPQLRSSYPRLNATPAGLVAGTFAALAGLDMRGGHPFSSLNEWLQGLPSERRPFSCTSPR